MNSLEYIRYTYDVPAEAGRRVVVNGKPGVIVSGINAHIGVNFDKDKPGVVLPCHPTHAVIYEEMGEIREEKLSRSQRRYRDFIRIDPGCSFAEWMRFGPGKRKAARV